MDPQGDIEDLEGLGVSVQSHTTLENDIIEKLEGKFKEKEQETLFKQIKKELRPLNQKITKAAEDKKKCEQKIKIFYKHSLSNGSNQSGSRQILSLLTEQENIDKQLSDHLSHQKLIIARLKESGFDYSKDPVIVNLIAENVTTPKSDDFENGESSRSESVETALQRDIRLGDVTAFGNSLLTKSSGSGEEINFDNYLKSQLGTSDISSIPSTSGTGFLKRKSSHSSSDEDTSGFVDIPKKKKLKAVQSPKDIKDSKDVKKEDDDSDWVPDEENVKAEPLIKKKKVKKSSKQMRPLYDDDEVGWKTDDSDFDGTDDEMETVKTKKKVGDDGDRDLYHARINNWQANRSEEEKMMDGKYEELEGGLKVSFYHLIIIQN